RSVDVAVDVVGPNAVDDPLGLKDRVGLRLDPRQAQRDAIGFGRFVDLGTFRRALGVDEVHALEIEYERTLVAVLGELADALLERFRGREEQPAVHAQHGYALEGLVRGVLVEVPEDLGSGLPPE